MIAESQASDAPAADRPGAAVALVDQPGATVRLAGCCTPVPPDEITGFAVRGEWSPCTASSAPRWRR